MKQSINQPVNITALGFKRGMNAYPRRMEFDGKIYTFIDAGLSYVAKNHENITQIMTMTDGRRQFRLRNDDRGGVWTLLDVSNS